MTKQQKARAHLARAQELLDGQGTLAFGGVSDWFKGRREGRKFGGEPPINMDNAPDDLHVEITRHLDGDGLLWFRKLGPRYKDTVHTLMQERTRGDQGETNLMKAFKKGDIVMVKLLLQYGAQMTSLELLRQAISTTNSQNVSNLTDLASKIIISRLSTSTIETGKFHTDYQIFKDHTVLMYAIRHGKYDIAKLLVKRGADVNGKYFRVDGDDTDDTPLTIRTPLDWACMRVHFYDEAEGLSFVRSLLENGANPRMMGKYRYLLNEDEVQYLPPNERKLSDILRSPPGAQA